MLLLLSFVVFYISRLAPGDPLRSYYGDQVERMTTEQKIQVKEQLGLNQPIYRQYQIWLQNAIKGNFGISFQYKQSVSVVVKNHWVNTLILGLSSYLLTFLLALLLGVSGAVREDSWYDKIICNIGTALSCIPSFWIALILILIFSVNLSVLPSFGAYGVGQSGSLISRINHLILPLIVLILGHLWYYAYFVRNLFLEEFQQDYVLFCRAKGLTSHQIVWKHCLRNMLPSYFSMMVISIPHIIGGTYIVEQVFSYPGLGKLCFESAKYHDYNLLMLLCCITGFFVLCSSMLSQLLSIWLNPQTRKESRMNAKSPI